MKKYIKSAQEEKPLLKTISTEWEEIDNGIKFTVYSFDDEILFEAIFDYYEADPDQIPDSAFEMARMTLSQKYELSDAVLDTLTPTVL